MNFRLGLTIGLATASLQCGHVEPLARPRAYVDTSISGSANVYLQPPGFVEPGSVFVVSIYVDLQGIGMPSLYGGRRPATLGDYELEVTYDANQVHYVSADPGDVPGFGAMPAIESKPGIVALAGHQKGGPSAVGLLKVAVLKFTMVGSNATTMSLRAKSLATSSNLPLPTEGSSITVLNLRPLAEASN